MQKNKQLSTTLYGKQSLLHVLHLKGKMVS